MIETSYKYHRRNSDGINYLIPEISDVNQIAVNFGNEFWVSTDVGRSPGKFPVGSASENGKSLRRIHSQTARHLLAIKAGAKEGSSGLG